MPDPDSGDMEPRCFPSGERNLGEEDGRYPTEPVGADGANSAARASEPVDPVAARRRACDTPPWPAVFTEGMTDILFDDEDAEVWSFSNRIKGAIEDHIGAPVAWWPLSPRLKPLTDGSSRIRWKCVGWRSPNWAERLLLTGVSTQRCGKNLSSVVSAAGRAQLERWLSTQSSSANQMGDQQASAATGGC